MVYRCVLAARGPPAVLSCTSKLRQVTTHCRHAPSSPSGIYSPRNRSVLCACYKGSASTVTASGVASSPVCKFLPCICSDSPVHILAHPSESVAPTCPRRRPLRTKVMQLGVSGALTGSTFSSPRARFIRGSPDQPVRPWCSSGVSCLCSDLTPPSNLPDAAGRHRLDTRGADLEPTATASWKGALSRTKYDSSIGQLCTALHLHLGVR